MGFGTDDRRDVRDTVHSFDNQTPRSQSSPLVDILQIQRIIDTNSAISGPSTMTMIGGPDTTIQVPFD